MRIHVDDQEEDYLEQLNKVFNFLKVGILKTFELHEFPDQEVDLGPFAKEQ
jgi:hypothetical protein